MTAAESNRGGSDPRSTTGFAADVGTAAGVALAATATDTGAAFASPHRETRTRGCGAVGAAAAANSVLLPSANAISTARAGAGAGAPSSCSPPLPAPSPISSRPSRIALDSSVMTIASAVSGSSSFVASAAAAPRPCWPTPAVVVRRLCFASAAASDASASSSSSALSPPNCAGHVLMRRAPGGSTRLNSHSREHTTQPKSEFATCGACGARPLTRPTSNPALRHTTQVATCGALVTELALSSGSAGVAFASLPTNWVGRTQGMALTARITEVW